MEHSNPILQITDLTVSYHQADRWLDAVRDVSLSIELGQTYGLVGESGSGKSTLALAIMRCLGANGAVRKGTIELAGRDLLALSDADMRQVWREQIRLVPQNPLSSLNPSMRVGEQIAETLDPRGFDAFRRLAGLKQRVLELLSMVRIGDPQRVAESYPHQLSGGMQQRVMIAMALSGEPKLLVLDEPTTNLDVTTEAAILDLIRDLIRARNTAVLYVSHSLGVVAQLCDRVAVLYAGELVEDASVADLYRQPLHPYTQGLLDSVPRVGQNKHHVQLRPIPGQIPQLSELPTGCVFAPRCHLANELTERVRPLLETVVPEVIASEAKQSRLAMTGGRHRVRCHRWREIMAGAVSIHQPLTTPTSNFQQSHRGALAQLSTSKDVVLAVNKLEKRFAVHRSPIEVLKGEPPRQIRAVDGIDLQIGRGKTLGLVGESGSGKTTAARCIIGLSERTGGELTLLDIPLARSITGRGRDTLRHLQMVFQNPEEALNPYLSVGEILRRPLLTLARYARAEADATVPRLLSAVKLSPSYASRVPGQLSGGEKQRVAIARAFAAHPELLIFDEAVSSLDVSVQASILNLLNELQIETQNAALFISHDLAVVAYLADEIAVMYLGRLMEVRRTDDIFEPPYHPYTEALLSAIPLIDPEAQQETIRLAGDVPSPINIPSGCPFHTRCPRFLGDICVQQEPPWQEGEQGQRIYCHIPLAELKRIQKKVSSEQ